ncbi:MAG: hypothetical protein RR847_05085 [Bacilli bacterium]
MEEKEYEYSFKVKSINPFIAYCKENDYEFIKETEQIRTLYKNENKTNARITIEKKDGVISKVLDFKDDVMSDEILIVRRETQQLNFENEEAVLSILNFLEYKKNTVLNRKRYVYKKDNVKFEIDDYSSPEVAYVVAIEGEKAEVDNVYNEVKDY